MSRLLRLSVLAVGLVTAGCEASAISEGSDGTGEKRSAEFARRDAPAPPDLSARPDERLLDSAVGTPGVLLFLAGRSLRTVLTDEAPSGSIGEPGFLRGLR